MMRLDRITQVGLWGLTGIALAGGLLLLGSSYLPFELVKAKMNTFSGDGTSASFTHNVFEQIVVRCRGGGIALLLVSGGLFAARHQIRQATSAALLSVRSVVRESISALSAGMKGETREHLAVLAVVVLFAAGIRLVFITQPSSNSRDCTR